MDAQHLDSAVGIVETSLANRRLPRPDICI
jgi:hypothetical protein